MSSDPVIRAEGLGKAYRRYPTEAARMKDLLFDRPGSFSELWVLRDVSFQVGRGEAVGVIGRNGAGKSTLLKMISGTLRPTQGQAQVTGKVATLLELGAGFHGDYSGRDNARFAAAIMGLTERQFAAVAGDIERFADIGPFFDRRVSEYSSGMFARLAFSVNIHCRPDILIVDEILSVGDIAFQHKCITFLREFCDAGGTLLFVSHDDAAVRALCDRAIWLHDGRLQAEGAAEKVLRRYHTTMWKLQSGSDSFAIRDESPAVAKPQATPDEDLAAPEPPPNRFDPERLAAAPGGGRITEIAVLDAAGQPADLLRGGQDVALRITCQADSALVQPSVCFMLRNRLAQVLFGGRTGLRDDDLAAMRPGDRAEARLRFALPYIPTGDYTLELLLIARIDGEDRVLHRAPARRLAVNTTHISHGLANVGMDAVRIERPVAGGQA